MIQDTFPATYLEHAAHHHFSLCDILSKSKHLFAAYRAYAVIDKMIFLWFQFIYLPKVKEYLTSIGFPEES